MGFTFPLIVYKGYNLYTYLLIIVIFWISGSSHQNEYDVIASVFRTFL